MSEHDRTLAALRWLMRPIVRLLIARGVQLPAVNALLKQVYVDVAIDEFGIDDKPPTDSRVSILTGVHRRDVRSIRTDGMPSSAPPAMSLSATVIGRWLGDPTYVDGKGQPKALHRSADNGSPSFEELFQGISKDVHPRTVLDGLIDQKLVDWDQTTDVVRLKSQAFVPTADSEGLMRFFEMNLHDHLAAAVSNLVGDEHGRRFLERAVYYNHLETTSVDKIEGKARELGERVLNDLNSKALELQKADAGEDGTTERFRFGVFFYREDDPPKGNSS
ncbi:MAG: DUF6502 family protein [Pseudomonadota bacterium]